MMKKYFLIITCMILPVMAYANPPGPYQSQPDYRSSSQQNPGVLLRGGIEKVLAFLEGGGANNHGKLVEFIEREIANYFDFASMTRWSLGARARFMSNEQRQQATVKLRALFLQALVKQLSNYEPGRINYLPPRNRPNSNNMMLSLASYSRQGYLQRLDFHFYRSKNGWKIYDVAANGLRATSVYREHFRSQANYRRPHAYTQR